MAEFQLQVTTFPTSNLLADAVVSSWSCVTSTDADAVLFKNAVIAGLSILDGLAPDTVRRLGHTWKLFNRSDPEPRQPTFEGTWDYVGTPTGAPLPPEVALCLSFQGDAVSGQPQARKRGRVYMGPFDQSLVDATGRPNATMRTNIAAMGDTLLSASDAAAGWTWTVYSVVNGFSEPITNGWVDNEFDTMRSRGRVPTVRTVFN